MRFTLQASPTDLRYLAFKQGKVMAFRVPKAHRRLGFLLSVGHTFYLVLLPLMCAILKGGLPLYVASLTGTGLTLFSFYNFAGPNDIRLDGDRRTYERTRGFPWKPTTRSGSFEDIRAVCVSPGGQAVLLMKKRGLLYKGIVLSEPGFKAAADALAEEVSREFGFPVVPYPK